MFRFRFAVVCVAFVVALVLVAARYTSITGIELGPPSQEYSPLSFE